MVTFFKKMCKATGVKMCLFVCVVFFLLLSCMSQTTGPFTNKQGTHEKKKNGIVECTGFFRELMLIG